MAKKRRKKKKTEVPQEIINVLESGKNVSDKKLDTESPIQELEPTAGFEPATPKGEKIFIAPAPKEPEPPTPEPESTVSQIRSIVADAPRWMLNKWTYSRQEVQTWRSQYKDLLDKLDAVLQS